MENQPGKQKAIDRIGNVVKATGWFAMSGLMATITVAGTALGMRGEDTKEGFYGTVETFSQGVDTLKDAFRN